MSKKAAEVTPGKVLVAEDNLITQKLLGAMLRQWGHCVSVVSNGLEALDQLRQQAFDAVILDYQMPQMDGFQTLEAIRADMSAHIRAVPVIFLTSVTDDQALKQLEDRGVKYFLRKPIQPDLLARTLELLLKKTPPAKRQPAAKTAYLRKITSGNRQLMAEIIAVFIEEAPANFHKMKSFCLLEDWPALRKMVHKIRSNYKYVGIQSLETELRDLEEDLERRHQPDTYLARILHLEAQTAEALEGLRKKRHALLGKE